MSFVLALPGGGYLYVRLFVRLPLMGGKRGRFLRNRFELRLP